jgi:hypothetical protein
MAWMILQTLSHVCMQTEREAWLGAVDAWFGLVWFDHHRWECLLTQQTSIAIYRWRTKENKPPFFVSSFFHMYIQYSMY